MLGLIFLNRTNLRPIFNIHLIQFKYNSFRNILAFVLQHLHCNLGEVDLTRGHNGYFCFSLSRCPHDELDLVTEWMSLLMKDSVVVGANECQESIIKTQYHTDGFQSMHASDVRLHFNGIDLIQV